MNKKIIISSLYVFSVMMPNIILAAPGIFAGNLTDVANSIITLFLNILWIIASAFVIVMFVIAGFKFLTAQGNPQQVAEARLAVIWGLVGAAVIVLAWSIVTIVSRQFTV